MRYLFITYLFILPFSAIAQNKLDKEILIILDKDSGAYEKVRLALIKNDFIVKDDGNKDTITTYPREFKTMDGFCVFRAAIKDSLVVLSGVYGMKKLDDWGYTTSPRKYKPIIYYKGSKAWRFLQKVAETIGNKFSYR